MHLSKTGALGESPPRFFYAAEVVSTPFRWTLHLRKVQRSLGSGLQLVGAAGSCHRGKTTWKNDVFETHPVGWSCLRGNFWS